jgi:hypothetical protein
MLYNNNCCTIGVTVRSCETEEMPGSAVSKQGSVVVSGKIAVVTHLATTIDKSKFSSTTWRLFPSSHGAIAVERASIQRTARKHSLHE